MEIPTAKYGKTTKNMEKMHVIMRVKMQWVQSLKGIAQRPGDIFSIL